MSSPLSLTHTLTARGTTEVGLGRPGTRHAREQEPSTRAGARSVENACGRIKTRRVGKGLLLPESRFMRNLKGSARAAARHRHRATAGGWGRW